MFFFCCLHLDLAAGTVGQSVCLNFYVSVVSHPQVSHMKLPKLSFFFFFSSVIRNVVVGDYGVFAVFMLADLWTLHHIQWDFFFSGMK